MMPKTGAKDFFVYIGAIGLLYVSFGSLINLLFNYINYFFPDVLTDSYYYYDPYTAAVRFSLAVLIILFPVFWYATYYINKDLRANPEKQDMPIRKWLTYLTIFVASIIVIGDLIALVNTFLNGEITTRFVLKVLTVLVLTGLALLYYTWDLKGKYLEKPMVGRAFGIVAGLIVISSIVGGFFVIGSPQSQRMIRFDQQKINDLQNIQWQIVSFWQQKEKLPKDLNEMVDPISGFVIPKDKETGKDYEYILGEGTSFKLCANFNKESNDRTYPSPYGGKGGSIGIDSSVYPMPAEDQNWKHGSGRTCFERKIDPERYPPIKRPL